MASGPEAGVVVRSVNLGTVAPLFIEQSGHTHRIATAIHKQPVAGSIMVKKLGLVGDEQADLSVHGGLGKAVYAYPSEHYAFWRARRQQVFKRDDPLLPGSMGENLTLQGILENDVWVGDRLHIGSAVLEVTEPRKPCFKFNAKMGFSHAAKLMIQAGNSGFYLRVIETGALSAGDTVALYPGPRDMSIAQINERHRKGRQSDLF